MQRPLKQIAKQKRPREEEAKRSLAKAITWRIVGTLDTFFISIVMITHLGPHFGMQAPESHAHLVQTASSIALTEVATKFILYYLHERFWNKVKWGASDRDGRRDESNLRTTAKVALWRILASLDTMLLAWFFTGNFLTAFSIGSFEVLTKLVLYFIHERIWLNVRFGLKAD